jgi:hypothetical protein
MSTLLAAAAFTTLALAEPQVSTQADPPKPSEHRWRLHADLSPAQLQSQTRVGYHSRSWVLGLPGSFSIGFGHTLGRYVLMGTRVGAELRHHDYAGRIGDQAVGSRSVNGSASLLPYVELRPLPDRRVQPFGLLEGGITLAGLRRISETGFTSFPGRSFQINPSVAGRVGLHAFVLPRLSIDADVGVRRYWSFEWTCWPQSSPVPAEDQALRLQVAATVGISGWW